MEQRYRLAERYGRLAREAPGAFRKRVALVFGGAFCYLAAIMAVLALALGWAVLGLVRGDGGSVGIAILAGLGLWAGVSGLLSAVTIPAGTAVGREAAPGLFAALDGLRAEMAVGQVSEVRIDANFNASAHQRPLFGLIGFDRFYLVLGLPLLALFTGTELRAILAHELAHFGRAHGRWSRWSFRIREAWGRLQQASGLVGILLRPYAWALESRFEAVEAALSRTHEFEADRMAAGQVGVDLFGRALLRLHLVEREMADAFFPERERQALASGKPPADEVTATVAFLRGWEFDHGQPRRRLIMALSEPAELGDSHPSLWQRLAELGAVDGVSLPRAVEQARVLTGDAPHPAPRALDAWFADPDALVAAAEQQFLGEAGESWEKYLRELAENRRRLGDLETRAGRGRPAEEEAWERVGLVYRWRGSADGRAALKRFLDEHPDHAEAAFRFASELYEAGDPRWESWAARAAGADPTWEAARLRLRKRWLLEQGKPDEAEALEGAIIRESAALDRVVERRRRLSQTTTFAPHGLPPDVVARVREPLAGMENLRALYLARRKLAPGSGPPQFVILADLKAAPWKFESREWEAAAVAEAVERLEFHFPYSCLVLSTSAASRRVRRRISRQEGAEIFRRAKV